MPEIIRRSTHNFVWEDDHTGAYCRTCHVTYPKYKIDRDEVAECAGRPLTHTALEHYSGKKAAPRPADWRRSAQ